MATIKLTPSYLGESGASGVYRIDLAQFGLETIQAITIHDDNVISGGTGGASGFDLDFVKISTTFTGSPFTGGNLTGEAVFDFSGGVVFRGGFMRPWRSGDSTLWNTSHLFGTVNNVYSPGKATLGVLDAEFVGEGGGVSLGEAGEITLLLNGPLGTAGRYLYFGDGGGGNDAVYVSVSTERSAPANTGVILVGTSSDDTILFGQGVNVNLGTGDDVVDGSGGNDSISTGAGSDTVRGGPGNDTITGGADTDAVVYGSVRAAYAVSISGGTVTVSQIGGGGEGTDTLFTVEELRFTDQWVPIALPGVNRFGGGSADVLLGDGLDDVLVGNAGNDYLYARDGRDYLYGGDGVDVLIGEGGNDILLADGDNDYLYGGNGHDTMYGGAGVDVFIGGAGADLMIGDTGGDYFYGEDGNNQAYGGEGNDIFVGGAGDEVFVGEAGNDYAYAGDGNDSLFGGDGVDVLLGQGGSDLFDAGGGVDYLFLGDGGNDLVLVNAQSGIQVIFGFSAGGVEDAIAIAGSPLGSLAQVVANTYDYGAFCIIQVDADTALWLIGVTSNQLTAADFSFS